MSEIDRAELARLASEADLPWRAKGHWVHSNADVVAMAEDSEQGGRDVQFIAAACNAVPMLLAQLTAAEQRVERLELAMRHQVSHHNWHISRLYKAKREQEAMYGQWLNGNIEVAQLATAERDALRDAIVGE
jgi:hypothetical protein